MLECFLALNERLAQTAVQQVEAPLEELGSETTMLREQVEDLRASALLWRSLYETAIRRVAEREGEIRANE
jgi:hypothetical protein